MGMSRINGPEALPLKPAGLENLGKATNNICEAGALYAFAHHTDYGQRLPTDIRQSPRDPKTEVRHGQDTILDLDVLYYVRHCERTDSHRRTRKEESARREAVLARRKLKKKSKKICKALGIKYQ